MHHADGKKPASRIALARKNSVATQVTIATTATTARMALSCTEGTRSSFVAPRLDTPTLCLPPATFVSPTSRRNAFNRVNSHWFKPDSANDAHPQSTIAPSLSPHLLARQQEARRVIRLGRLSSSNAPVLDHNILRAGITAAFELKSIFTNDV